VGVNLTTPGILITVSVGEEIEAVYNIPAS
jgi:hypothetical protein